MAKEPELTSLFTPDSKNSSLEMDTSLTVTPSVPSALAEQVIELVPINPKRILVVDDNEINRKIMAKILGSVGYQISVACDGVEAVKKIVTSQVPTYFVCIFMDISMPNMDGYEATRNIRMNNIHVPIIALTANSLSEEKTKAETAGMNHFCTKPLRKDKVVKLLDKLLNNSTSPSSPSPPSQKTLYENQKITHF